MNHKKVGLDKWRLHQDLSTFLLISAGRGWTIYDVQNKDEIIFYASVMNRNDIMRVFDSAELITTSGVIGFLLRSFHKPSRILSLLAVISLWYGLSHMVFAIDIRGEKEETKEKIEAVLKQLHKEPPFYSDDEKALKATLKKTLENDIAWLEIEKKGSKYIVYYTPKEFANIESLNRNELIAQKDGVIAGFELQHGNKNCKLNDFIHKGDVLISNILMDSTNKAEEVYVKGKVYAYTWEKIEVSMDPGKLPKAFQFYQLLFEARRAVSEDFRKGDRIHKENILHFDDDAGKIKLVVLYTLYEDITTPR